MCEAVSRRQPNKPRCLRPWLLLSLLGSLAVPPSPAAAAGAGGGGEQVERIEVIRGPGSVIYGDFAFMGLINIISRKEGTRAHLRADDDHLLAAGGNATLGGAATPWQLTANLSAARDTDADVEAPRS